MKALILAAGVSRRLYPLTYQQPKCLLQVGKKPILNYQLDALRELGIHDITIVLGYFREKILEHINRYYSNLNITAVINHHYFETNTAYSVQLALPDVINGQFLLMNGDVVYPQRLLKKVVQSQFDSALAVEIKPCGREEVKVVAGDGNRIVAIGKELIQENALGEFIGVAKFSGEFGRAFQSSLDRLITSGGTADYFEAGIHNLLSEHDIYYEDVTQYPCIEVDFKEDLERAQSIITSEWYK
ncbi:MAG: sugar phosphate nucleotidyltransferase [Fidelibacterota bacterium]